MNDSRISQLDVAGIVRLDHFPAKSSDIEVLRLVLVAHGEEVSGEEASRAIGASGDSSGISFGRQIRVLLETPTRLRKKSLRPQEASLRR